MSRNLSETFHPASGLYKQMNNAKEQMKARCFSVLALSTLSGTLSLLDPDLAMAETTRTLEPAQLREDFKIARQSLEEAHPGLYRYTKKADMDRIFDETEHSLDRPMDFYEFYRVMAVPIAAIKCGHTDIDLSADVRKETELLPWLPFDVKVLGCRAYIFRDYAKGGGLAGKEIQSINGVPAARILSTMLAAESQDGDIQTSRQKVISQHFGSNLVVLLGLRAPYEVVLAGSGKDQLIKVQVAGMKHEELVKMSKTRYPQDEGRRQFADLKFLDEGQIAYLTYSAFGEHVEAGQSFMKRVFEAIRAKGSRAMILDLGGNLGGENELGALLLSYLVNTPFRYYEDQILKRMSGGYDFAKYADDGRPYNVPEGMVQLRADGRMHVVTDPLLGLQRPSEPTFAGPVYLLIDGRCFSTAAEFLTEIHIHHRATFIGEESAGAYYGNNSGEVPRITLPHSKLGLYIPLVSYYMAVGGNYAHEAARGIIPDYLVDCTIADLLAGADRDFDLALELARKR
jgi:C-terminal processing protease CtpA/Prc